MKARLYARARVFWRDWLRPLIVTAVVLGSFRSAIADWNDVPSGSMIPTILVGDRVLVNRAAYDLKVPFTTWHLAQWSNPARGDVVVLVSPYDGIRLLKRVVAIPGDTIELRAGHLIINGERAEYSAPDPAQLRRACLGAVAQWALAVETVADRSHLVVSDPGDSFGPLEVPRDRYFLMGDHRDSSFDSRYWGFAARSAILGRVSAVALSLDFQHGWHPRWGRFFSSVQ